MAIIRTGPLAASISGSIGGTNFAHTKNGTVARKNLFRTIQRSPQHALAKALFAANRNAWRALTVTQKQAWNVAALAQHHVNRLGIATKLSGYALFMQANTAGRPFFDPNSQIPTFPDPPDLNITSTVQILTVTFNLSTDYFITWTPIDVQGADYLVVYAARTFSDSSIPAPTHYRALFFIQNFSSGIGFSGLFNGLLGTPQLNEIVFIQIRKGRADTPLSAPETFRRTVLA